MGSEALQNASRPSVMPNRGQTGAPSIARNRWTPLVTEKPLAFERSMRSSQPASFSRIRMTGGMTSQLGFRCTSSGPITSGSRLAEITTSPPKKTAGPHTHAIGALCSIGLGV